MSCQHGGCSAVAALPHQPTAAPRVSAKSPGNIPICQAVRKTPPFLSTNSATSRGEFLLLPSLLRRSFCPAHCVLRAHTGNEDAGKGAKRGKGRESQEARELLAQNDGSLVASTAQHSLPGRRYPLPGPDSHRLDLASFLAHWCRSLKIQRADWSILYRLPFDCSITVQSSRYKNARGLQCCFRINVKNRTTFICP
jgi:hypothetical protein